REHRPEPGARQAGPAPALLQGGQHGEHRQREQAAVERGGGGAGTGELYQHRPGGGAGPPPGGPPPGRPPARRPGRRPAGAGAGPAPLPVMTVLAYGADRGPPLREPSVSSQKGFGADLLEALTAAAELINAGRSVGGEGLRTVADVAAFGRRYGMGGRAREGDVGSLRAHRARLDAIVTACEAGDGPAAVRVINARLAEAGAIPPGAARDGRRPPLPASP